MFKNIVKTLLIVFVFLSPLWGVGGLLLSQENKLNAAEQLKAAPGIDHILLSDANGKWQPSAVSVLKGKLGINLPSGEVAFGAGSGVQSSAKFVVDITNNNLIISNGSAQGGKLSFGNSAHYITRLADNSIQINTAGVGELQNNFNFSDAGNNIFGIHQNGDISVKNSIWFNSTGNYSSDNTLYTKLYQYNEINTSYNTGDYFLLRYLHSNSTKDNGFVVGSNLGYGGGYYLGNTNHGMKRGVFGGANSVAFFTASGDLYLSTKIYDNAEGSKLFTMFASGRISIGDNVENTSAQLSVKNGLAITDVINAPILKTDATGKVVAGTLPLDTHLGNTDITLAANRILDGASKSLTMNNLSYLSANSNYANGKVSLFLSGSSSATLGVFGNNPADGKSSIQFITATKEINITSNDGVNANTVEIKPTYVYFSTVVKITQWTTASRPVLAGGADRGAFGFNTDLNKNEYWNGSAWVQY